MPDGADAPAPPRRSPPSSASEPTRGRSSPSRCAGTRMLEVLRALDAADVDAHDISRREATLDDVFLSLTETKEPVA